MADATLRFNILARDQNTKRTLEGIADAAEDAGDEFKDMARAAASVDDEIGDLEREILKLKTAMAGVSGDLFKDMDRQLRGLESTLRRKMNVRKAFGDAGNDGALEMSASFSQKIGPLLLKAPITPALGAAAVGAAPLIASGISAGVTAGLAGGAVAGGIALAMKDPQIQAEAKGMSDRVGKVLENAAMPFRGELSKAFVTVEDTIRDLKPVLDDVFRDSARYVQPLTNALTGFARNLAPGVASAVRQAEPLVQLVEEHGPAMGRVLSDAFANMARSSKEAADNLDGLLTGVEAAVAGTGVALGTLSKFSSLLGTGPLAVLGATMDDTSEKTAEAARQAAIHASAVASMNGALSLAEQRTRAMASGLLASAEAAQTSTDATLGLWDATTRYEAAQDAAAASAKENGKTLDSNTEKGRANRDALRDLAVAANSATLQAVKQAAASGNSGAAMAAAAAKARTYREDLIKAAMGMGLSRAAAERYVDSLAKVPKSVLTTVSVNGIGPSIAELGRLKSYIAGIPRYVGVTIQGNVRVAGGGQIMRQHGGPVEAGRPYIVGEKRAEWFVPKQDGTVLPRVPAGARASAPHGGATSVSLNVSPTGFNGLERVFLSWLLEAVRGQFGSKAAQNLQGL